MGSKNRILIAGHGIAGALLAENLQKLGAAVTVAEPDTGNNTATRIAAGMFTPLTGHKLVKTWQADLLFPFLNSYYRNLQEKLGKLFFNEMPVYRPFNSIEDQNTITARSSEPEIQQYMNTNADNESYSDYVKNCYGGYNILKAGWVNTVVLLDALKEKLQQSGNWVESRINPAELKLSENEVIWQERIFDKVIFCNGMHAAAESIFAGIPFTPLKGETITIKSAELPVHSIINGGGVYVVPLGLTADAGFKVGATYEHKYTNSLPTEAGLQTLVTSLEKLISVPFEIITHNAGIRPAIQGRRPVLGFLPHSKNIGIFNGLGTKGISLAPLLASQFANHIVSGIEIMAETDIKRFYR
ncbi:MAG: FAD-dependent oxidoreductase [Bacteroidota bacterium]